MSTPTATPSLAVKSSPQSILPFALLFLLAILPFLPAIKGEFTWDDDQWLTDNSVVHAWNGLPLIWNPLHQTLHFYPILFTSLWAQHKLWALNPIGYHAVNILSHAISALLLWRILRRLNLRSAWLAALLWAIHPVQVETVAWISEQKNTLSGIFYFLSALLYLHFADIPPTPSAAEALSRRKKFLYLASLLSFACALLAKIVVSPLPAALLLILWWKQRPLTRRNLLPLIPFFILALIPSIFASFQEHFVIVVGGSENLHFSFLQRFFIAGKDVCFYLRTLVVPYPLMPIYPKWSLAYTDPLNYLAPLAVAATLLLLYGLRKRLTLAPFIAFAIFLVTLSPALGFINFYTMHYTFVADHYQYLACLAPLTLLTEALYRAIENRKSKIENAEPQKPPALVIASALLITALLPLTAFYSSLFQTNLKLWSWNIAQNPDAFTAHHNLAVILLNAGQTADGLRELQIAVQQEPNSDTTQRTVARVALSAGRFDDALAAIHKSIDLRPDFPGSYILLGDIQNRLNHPDEALAAYTHATSLAPYDPKAWIAYAECLKKNHQLPEAAKAYESAISSDPGNLITRYNYANLLLDLHRPNDAIPQYLFIIKYQSNNPNVWYNLAAAYHDAGDDTNARVAQQRATELEHPAAK